MSTTAKFHLPKVSGNDRKTSHLPKMDCTIDCTTVSRETPYFYNKLRYWHIETQRELFGHIHTCRKHTPSMQVINLIAHTIPPRVSTYRYFALLQLLTLSHSFRRSRTNLKRQYHSILDPTPNDISFIAATTLKRRKYHHCDKKNEAATGLAAGIYSVSCQRNTVGLIASLSNLALRMNTLTKRKVVPPASPRL